MKIKVVTLKDILIYLAKIGMVFGVITIFANFFYTNKNVNACLAVDAKKFMGVIKQEILPLKSENITNINLNSENYAKQTFNNELSMIKAVAVQNVENTVLSDNEVIQENVNAQSIDNNEKDTNFANENNGLVEAPVGVSVEVMPSKVANKYTYEIFGVQLRNESDYDLPAEITDLNVDYNKQDIMIFHTHTCESYTPTEKYTYNETGTFRTTDLNYTVSRVADELEKYLTNYGFCVVHDKTYHDYPAYTGSYDRSLITVKSLLSTYQNTDIVIDLHRDAIGDNTYAPKVKIGDEYCSRLMFVIGTDGGGLTHENWRDNLKFAIKVQQKANELYPGLFKPIIVRNSRYNHQVASGACIIEVGATGNTLEESINSMKYLARVLSEV